MSTTSTLKRSLVKTIGYRAAVVLVNGVVTYQITGRMDATIGISSVTALTATVMYFANERLWNKIEWGRQVVT